MISFDSDASSTITQAGIAACCTDRFLPLSCDCDAFNMPLRDFHAYEVNTDSILCQNPSEKWDEHDLRPHTTTHKTATLTHGAANRGIVPCHNDLYCLGCGAHACYWTNYCYNYACAGRSLPPSCPTCSYWGKSLPIHQSYIMDDRWHAWFANGAIPVKPQCDRHTYHECQWTQDPGPVWPEVYQNNHVCGFKSDSCQGLCLQCNQRMPEPSTVDVNGIYLKWQQPLIYRVIHTLDRHSSVNSDECLDACSHPDDTCFTAHNGAGQNIHVCMTNLKYAGLPNARETHVWKDDYTVQEINEYLLAKPSLCLAHEHTPIKDLYQVCVSAPADTSIPDVASGEDGLVTEMQECDASSVDSSNGNGWYYRAGLRKWVYQGNCHFAYDENWLESADGQPTKFHRLTLCCCKKQHRQSLKIKP